MVKCQEVAATKLKKSQVIWLYYGLKQVWVKKENEY